MECRTLLTMLDYEEGFHAAALGVPFDPDASAEWQKGWNDCKVCGNTDCSRQVYT